MIITVKNLGVIKKAEFDTSKKLTVFCGPNSTGKTYLSYVIYAALSDSQIYKLKSFENVKHLLSNQDKDKEEFPKIPLKKEYFDELLPKISTSCKNRIGDVFGIQEEKEKAFFNKFNISFSISDKNYNDIINNNYTIKVRNRNQKYEFVIKEKQKNYLNSDIFFSKDFIAPSSYVFGLMLRRLVDQYVYMLPVERNSIYTFKTELSLNRNQLIDKILDNKRPSISINDLINNNTRRYPLVIKDNLYTANDLTTVQKHNSELYKCAKEIEEKLLHGGITITENGDVEFNVNEKVSLPIGMSSSIVKTLASLVITLKYQVKKGDLLIIDEPEMNLHPDNQILLARIFAQMVNMGIKLVISTHSDYIIRELNNLIMLSGVSNDDVQSFSKMGYDKSMMLKKEDVAAYMFNFDKDNLVTVENLDVTETGFEVSTIDAAINSINEASEELYYSLKSRQNEN